MQHAIDGLADRHLDRVLRGRAGGPRARRPRPRRRGRGRRGSPAARVPSASARPTRRLRERSPVQVSTRSPSPASPISVSRRPPSARGQPARLGEPARDQRRARVVAEAQAVARARGDRQHVLDRARRSRRRRCRRSRRRAACRRAAARRCRRRATEPVAATVSAVGSPRATSSAKLGPETTPTGARQRGAMRWCASATPALDARDEPLRQPDERRDARRPPTGVRTTSVSPATGVATTTRPARATPREVGGHLEVRRQRDARQVADVLARGVDGARLRPVARPQRDAGRARRRARRGAPRGRSPRRPHPRRRRSRFATARRPARCARSPPEPSRWRTLHPAGLDAVVAEVAASASSSSTFCSARKTTGAASSGLARTSATGTRTRSMRLSASALRSIQPIVPPASRTFAQPSTLTMTSTGTSRP